MKRNRGLLLLSLALTGSLCACSMPAVEPSPTPTHTVAPTPTPLPAPAVTDHGQTEVEGDTWEDAAGATRHAANDVKNAAGKVINGLRRNMDTMVENGKVR